MLNIKLFDFSKNTLITPYTISAINGHPRPDLPPPHQVCRKCSLCKSKAKQSKARKGKERKGKERRKGGEGLKKFQI
jgi:hypothetical protein